MAPDPVLQAVADSPALALPPLQVSGVFVSKDQLLACLRLFLPQLTDIEAIIGDRFLLHLGTVPDLVPAAPARTTP